MAETPPAARLAALRSEVEACAPHEIKKVGALLRQGADLLAAEQNEALAEGWCRWLIRDAGPNWRRALDEGDAADAVDAVVDRCGLCVASESLIGATAAAAIIVAQRVRSWDVAALVASLTDDGDDAERFADAAVRLPRRLATLLKGKSPLDEAAWLSSVADGSLRGPAWRVLAGRLEKAGHAPMVAARWVLCEDDGSRLDALGAGSACRYATSLLQATDSPQTLSTTITKRLRKCPVLRSKWTDDVVTGRTRLAHAKASLAVYVATKAGLYTEALAACSKKWKDVAFLQSVDDDRRAFLTTSILALLALSDPVDVDVNTTLSGIVSGVSACLDLNDEKDRARAMLVGDAFGTLVGRAPDFGDLLSESDRAWAREGLAVLPVDEVHAAFRNSHYSEKVETTPPPPPPPPAKKQKKKKSPDDVLESGSESSDDESVESATTLSDDDLEAYDLEDDGADLVPVQPPRYLRDLLKLINEGTDQELARERLQMALATCPALVRSRPADLKDVARDLAHAILATENRFDLDDFSETSRVSLAALTACRPVEVVRYLQLSFFDKELGLNKRLDALQAMVDGAYELAGRGRLAEHEDLPDGTAKALLGVGSTRSRKLLDDTKLLERTRRWGYRRTALQPSSPNLFAQHAASLFFFPLLRGVVEHWAPLERRHPHHSTVLRARAVHALACFLDCASSAPGSQALASHLLAFAWRDVRSADAALRRAARGAALTALAWRPCDDGGGALALLAGGICADLPSPEDVRALAYEGRDDPDDAARRLALALGELCPAGF
jgi:hypothetical protein